MIGKGRRDYLDICTDVQAGSVSGNSSPGLLTSHRVLLGDRRGAFFWAALLGLSLSVPLITALAPFLEGSTAFLIRAVFAPVCHQLPERSFSVDGRPFALCRRCWGLAAGLFLGALLVGPVFRQHRGLRTFAPRALIVAGSLMAAEWLLSAVRIHQGWSEGPFVTGAVVGFVTGWYVTDAVLDWAGFAGAKSLALKNKTPLQGDASPIEP